MKYKDFQKFKNKPTVELTKELNSHRERLKNLEFDLAAGKVKNIREIRQIKKSVAQILTLINFKNKTNA